MAVSVGGVPADDDEETQVTDRWTIKLHALLHDPPHKPLALGRGHERQGRALAQWMTGQAASDRVWEAIKRADALASGADRESWLKAVGVDPRTELCLLHPLDGQPVLVPASATGRPLELAFAPEVVDRATELVDRCADEFRAVGDARLRYLLFWRFAVDVLRAIEAEGEPHEKRMRCGVLWAVFPADSRMPDHPVRAHDSLVAALAPLLAAGEEAALVRFSFGPVQSFIAAARKLRDLWAGSSILAETLWRAMEPFVAACGPDAIVFPSLCEEPRFERWLLEQCQGLSLPGERPLAKVMAEARDRLKRGLRMPSLPNIFVALVPRSEAVALARAAADSVRGYWSEEVAAAAAEAGEGDAYAERAVAQALASIEIAWSVAVWPLPASLDGALGRSERLAWHRAEPLVTRALANRAKLQVALGGYTPNGGLLYADVFEQAVLLVDAAKRERLRVTRGEGGLKCSVCGEREVLGPGTFWEQRHQKRRDSRKLDEGEQLCGPCTWKRHFHLAAVGDRHPSTGEVAASEFKLAVIRRCNGGDRELRAAVQEFVDAVEAAVEAGAIKDVDARVFCAQAVHAEAAKDDMEGKLMERFACVDGQWLLAYPREEPGKEPPRAVMRAADGLRRAAGDGKSKIALPRPYLAIVVFDGDEMGKWVSGTHERFPRLWNALHHKVQDALAKEGHTRETLRDVARFLSPALHGALSAAASTFARLTAPLTIEGEEVPGHLVYAGGDDALFVAPVPAALDLVWRLRRRFSGWPGPFGAEEEQEAPCTPWVVARLGQYGLPLPSGVGDEQPRRLGLAFGAAATASAGMCVFHYRWPLSAALELAREAERAAKESGRDALGITIQRRSGSITKAVVPFLREGALGTSPADDGGGGDAARPRAVWRLGQAPIHQFCRLVALLAEDKASPRLASLFRSEIEALRLQADSPAAVVWDMVFELARRVVRRRDLVAAEAVGGELEEVVLGLGSALRARNQRAGIRLWGEALTAAAFLARPE